MKNIATLFLSEEVKPGEAGAGGTGYSAELPKPPEQPAPAQGNPPTEPQGDQFDQYGYKIVKAQEGDPDQKGKGDPKPESEKPPEEEKIDPGTGYDADKPPVETPPAEQKPDEQKPDDKTVLGYEVNFEGLPEEDKTKIIELAKGAKDPKELLERYIAFRKSEIAEITKAQQLAEQNYESEKIKVRSNWHKELKEDPNFGGEKFAHNIHQAEKVLHDVMPETKKELTKRGSMLPPYVMRDLAKLADRLYATPKLQQGDPPKPIEDKEKESSDPLDFYRSK